MAFLQTEAIGIFGAAHNKSGEDVEKIFSVWHSEYATLHSSCELGDIPVPGVTAGKRKKNAIEERPISLTTAIGGMGEVLVCSGSEVHLQAIELPPLSLASAMGSMVGEGQNPPMVCEPSLTDALGEGLELNAKFESTEANDSWESGVKPENESLGKMIKVMASEKSCPNEKKLMAKLEEHCTSSNDIPPEMVNVICERCCGPSAVNGEEINTSPIFAPKALSLLAKRGLLSARLHGNVLPRCMASGSIALLIVCIRHMPDLPEHMLVTILRFFATEVQDSVLEAYHAELSSSDKKQKNAKSVKRCNVTVIRERLIARCMHVPCNSGFLVPCLQEQLKEEDILRIFHVLHWWLVQYNEATSVATSLSKKGKGPTHSQSLDWTSMMLDACFGSVVLSAATSAVAEELKRLIDEQVSLCEALHNLEEFRGISKGAMPIPAVPEYSVEVLYM